MKHARISFIVKHIFMHLTYFIQAVYQTNISLFKVNLQLSVNLLLKKFKEFIIFSRFEVIFNQIFVHYHVVAF